MPFNTRHRVWASVRIWQHTWHHAMPNHAESNQPIVRRINATQWEQALPASSSQNDSYSCLYEKAFFYIYI